jgi:hypothetical protein
VPANNEQSRNQQCERGAGRPDVEFRCRYRVGRLFGSWPAVSTWRRMVANRAAVSTWRRMVANRAAVSTWRRVVANRAAVSTWRRIVASRAAVSTWRRLRRQAARAAVSAWRLIRRLHLAARSKYPICFQRALGRITVLRVRGAERRNDKDARKSQDDTYSHTTSAVSRESDIEPHHKATRLPAFRNRRT